MTRHYGGNRSLAFRLCTAAVQEGGSLSENVFERSLLSRLEGDSGSVLQCYVTDLCDTLSASKSSADAKDALVELQKAYPSVSGQHKHIVTKVT